MIKTLIVLMLLLLFTAALTVAMRVTTWALWYFDKNKTCPHVSYKSFREFYAVAPDKWEIRSDYLKYRGDRVELEKYSDLLKCRRFKKQLKKRGGELEKDRRQADFIRNVQNDIDKYRKEALEKMKILSHEECKEELNYIVYAMVEQNNSISCISYNVLARSKDEAAKKIKQQYDGIEIMRVDAIYE